MIQTEAQATPTPTPPRAAAYPGDVSTSSLTSAGGAGAISVSADAQGERCYFQGELEMLRLDSLGKQGRRVPDLCCRHRADGGAPWDPVVVGCRHGPGGSLSSDLDTNALRGGLTLI